MAVEVTYETYRVAGGTLPEAAYADVISDAVTAVDYLIGQNEVTDEDAYMKAVVAAAKACYDHQGGASVSIGSFSASGDSRETTVAATNAAYMALATTGMVWGGLA